MAETVGIRAILDMGDFNRGVDIYLRDIGRIQAQTSAVASSLSAQLDQLGKVSISTTNSLGQSGNIIEKMTMQLQTLGAVAVGTAAALTAVVGVGIGIAAKATAGYVDRAVQDAMQLQQQLADIASVMGKTLAEVEPLRENIEALAIDPNLKVTTFEAAEAMEILARNGLELEQILGGAAKATVALANATGGTFEKSAAVATDAINVFGANISDVGNFVGQVTAVVNRSKFDLQDYQYALSNAGAVAQTLGLTFEEFNAGIIGISSAFNSGRRAGTSFTNFLVNMVPKSKQAASVMAAIGLVTEEGNLAFFDAKGAFLGLENAAQVLQDTFGKMSEAERDFFIRQVFGIEALESVIELMKLGADGVRQVKAEMAEVDAFKTAETRMKTLAGALEVLDGLFEAMRIRFANKMLPGLERGVRALNTVLEQNFKNFGKLGDAMGILVDKAVDALIPLINKWIPALIDASIKVSEWIVRWIETGELFNDKFGQMPRIIQNSIQFIVRFGNALRIAVNRTMEFMTVVARAMRPLTDWIKQNITLEDVLVGLGIAVASFFAPLLIGLAKLGTASIILFAAISRIRVAWETNWGGIREFTAEVIERIRRIIDKGLHIIEEIFAKWGDDGLSILEKAFLAFQVVFLRILDIIENLLDVVHFLIHGEWREAWDTFKQIFIDLWDDIKPFLEQGIELLRPVMQDLVNQLMDILKTTDWSGAFNNLWDQAQPILGRLKDFVLNAFEEIKTRIMTTDWASLWQGALDGARTIFNNVKDFILEFDWAGMWQKAYDAIVPVFQQIEAYIKERIKAIWQEFQESDFYKTWKERFEAMRRDILTWYERFNYVIDQANEKWDQFKARIDGVILRIQELYDQFMANPFVQWILDTVTLQDALIGLGIAFSATFGTLAMLMGAGGPLGTFLLWFAAGTLAAVGFRLAWENNFAGIRDRLPAILAEIQNIISIFWHILEQIWAKGGSNILTVLEDVLGKMIGLVEGTLKFIELILLAISNALEKDWIGMWNNLTLALQLVLGGIRGMFVDLWESLKRMWLEDFPGLVEAVRGIIQYWRDQWEEFKETLIRGWTRIKDFLTTTWNEITYNLRPDVMQARFERWLDDTEERFDRWVNETRDKFQQWVNDIQTGFTEWATNTWATVSQWATDTWNTFSTWWLDTYAKYEEWRDNIYKTISDWATDTWDAIKTWATDTYNSLVEWVKDWIDKIEEWVTDVIKKVSQMVTDFIDAIKDLPTKVLTKFNEIYDTVSLWFTGFLSLVVTEAGKTWTKFTEGVGNLIDKAKAKFDEIKTGATTSLTELRDTLFSLGANAVQGLIDGIGSLIGAAQAKLSELMGLSAQAAATEIEAQSPSRVFMRIGGYAGEGFLIGLEDRMLQVSRMIRETLGNQIPAISATGGNLIGRAAPVAPAMAGATTTNYNYRNNQIAPNFDISVRDERDAHRLTQIIRKVINESL